MARWPELAPWRGPTVNQVRGHTEIRGLIVHIAQGSFEGTVSWCKDSRGEQAVSAHFVAGKNGQRAQLVDTDDTAWTQADGNGHWLSVECEGFVPDALTPQQVEFVAQLLARGAKQYGYPLQLATSPSGKGLGHHAMGGQAWGGHLDCPGPNIIAQKPAILARAQQIAGGAMTSPLTDAQNNALSEVWAATVAARDGVVVPATDSHKPAAPSWLVEQITAMNGKLDAIAAALAALQPGTGGLVAHTHEGGETGPAVPTGA